MKNEAKFARLRAALAIDAMRLSEELMEIPSNLMEVGECCAEAIAARDAAHLDKEIQKAIADAKLRDAPLIDGKRRAEAQISSERMLDEALVSAQAALDAAEFELGLWRALVNSMNSKAAALHKTADLTISGYISADSAHMQRRQELARERVRTRPVSS